MDKQSLFLPAIALDWHQDGRAIAIATVIATWGSAPRRIGSQMVVDAAGAMEGSVSGGCVEGAVVVAAQDAITSGQSQVMTFGVSDEDAFAVGLACGGEIRVLIEPVGPIMPPEVLQTIVTAHKTREAVVYWADLNGGMGEITPKAATAEVITSGASAITEEGDKFACLHRPSERLIIIGAVHIAQHLVQLAQSCGIEPILIDPRTAFGNAARFDGLQVIETWPDVALRALRPDRHTGVVTLSHDPKLDDPALMAALGTDAFYIGALGSRRTHAKRQARLREAGFGEDQIARIHGPVGLAIGAANPAEIAVSILAQMIQAMRVAA